MTTILLSAGDSTKSLQGYLESRGSSVRVEGAFDSLVKHSEDLKTGIFKADKLIYVYKDTSVDIRKDMRILQDLLTGSYYFSINEILFFISDPEEKYEGLNFFNATMQEVAEQAERDSSIRVPDQQIFRYNDKLAYDIIYTKLLGISEDAKVSNTRLSVYRAERNKNSNKAYEAADFSKEPPIEPFRYVHISNYQEMQKSVRNNDSGEFIIDSDKRTTLDKVDVDFGQLEYKDPSLKSNIIIVSGNSKCGSTTFSVALSASLVSANKKVMLLDMSRNKGLLYTMKEASIPYQSYSLEDLLLEKIHKQEQDVSVLGDFPEEISFDVLRNVVNNLNTYQCDILIIDTHADNLEEVQAITSRGSVKVFFMSTAKEQDIVEVSKLFEKVKKADLVLSKHINFQRIYKDMEVKDIKFKFSNLEKMLEFPIIEDFDLDESLAIQLLGER